MSNTTSLYDLPVRLALDKMPAAVREAWRVNYLTQDGAEHRAQALVERSATAMRERGELTTIRTVWMLLADRAGQEENADMRAAAALAGMAMGLRDS